MKTISFLKYLVFVLILGFGISSCTGDEGPPGPAGINGTNGSDGTDGTNGTNGTDGADGTNGTDGTDGTDGANSNIYYSNWLTPTWNAQTGSDGTKYRVGIITANTLTQSILDRGIVLVYLKTSSGPIIQIPVNSGGVDFQVIFDLREIIINYHLTDSPYVTPGALNSSNKIRYILVPGTILASKASKSKQDLLDELKTKVDVSNYLEVCSYYEINPE